VVTCAAINSSTATVTVSAQWHKQYQEQIPFVSEIQLFSSTTSGELGLYSTVATVDSASGVVTGVAAGTSDQLV
jgi:hypothetical protein